VGLIMVILAVGFVVSLLWAVIDWGKILREHFANNPAKGRVYIEVGEELFKANAKLTHATNKGSVYKYRWQGKDKVLIIPADYPVRFCDSRRVLAVRGGRLVASRLAGTPAGEKLDSQAISALVFSGLVTDLIMALTGKGFPKWLWVALGLAVVVMCVFAFKQCGGGGATSPVTPPINPETGEPFGMLLALLGV
jgi:hypothetical protein